MSESKKIYQQIKKLNSQASDFFHQRKYDIAVPLAKRALELAYILKNQDILATCLNDLGFLYQSQGRYSEAEPLLLQALGLRKKIFGENHPDVALSLSNLASLYRSQGRYGEAEPLLLQALELRKKIFGENAPDVVKDLSDLAGLYYIQGKFSKAEPLFLQALELRKRLFGDVHPDIATSLSDLGLLYSAQGRYSEAEPLHLQTLDLLKQLFGEDNHPVANNLHNLALLYSAQGRYSEAEPLFLQVLSLYKKLFGEVHPDILTCLTNLASVYRSQGKYSKAESLHLQALKLKKQLLGEIHPDTIISLNNLAILYVFQGRYSEAEPLLLQALELRQQILGKKHPDFAASLNNLGLLYYFQGRYSEAEPLFLQALKLRKQLLGEIHPDVATSLANLAVLYDDQRRYSEVEILYLQSLEIDKQLLGEQHPNYATILNNLALLYYAQGRYSEAESLCLEALDLRKKIFGEIHPDIANSLNNLALLYSSQEEKYNEAGILYLQALDLRKKIFGEIHPDIATSLVNLAVLYDVQGKYDEAERLFLQSLELRKQIFGRLNIYVADSLNVLAKLLVVTNRFDQAFTKSQEANLIYNQIIKRLFATCSEKDLKKYLNDIAQNFYILLSIVYQYLPESSEAKQIALDFTLKRKLLTFTLLATQSQIVHNSDDSELTKLWQKLISINEQITYLELHYNPEEQKRLPELQQQFDDLQRQINQKLPENEWQQRLVNRAEIASALPPNSILIEIVRFTVYNFEERSWQNKRYLAFTLPAGKPESVQMIDLGEAEEIEKIIQKLRQEVSLNIGKTSGLCDDEELNIKNYDSNPAIELSEKIYQPLHEIVKNYQHLIIAPDGQLNIVPWQILPVDDTGNTLLMDNYTVSYLSTGMDILRSTVPIKRQPSQPLIIADPDFDLGTNFDYQYQAQDSNFGSELFKIIAEKPCERYTGIKSLEKVAQKFKNVTSYLGENALETCLYNHPSPLILLISTHGIFLPDQDIKLDDKDQPKGKIENPMLRSGLALAGINTKAKIEVSPPEIREKIGKLSDEIGKGFVSAQDIARLDLWGNELTVLSACQTALGDIKIGEGVFGLRRAFTLAGAKCLIMSLWRVPDQATGLLMTRFFDNLKQGQGRGEALFNAQNYIRNITVKELSQTDLGKEILQELFNIRGELSETIKDYENTQPLQHPYYWGAWICQGDTNSFDLN